MRAVMTFFTVLTQAVAVVVVVAVVAILIPGLREVLAWKDGRR